MGNRKTAATWTAILAAIPGIVGIYIQIDRWHMEREIMRARLVARAVFEQKVAECEAGGGRWWKGNCLETEVSE